MPWWAWAVLGIVLLGAELLTPGGFFVIFFGAAALVTAAAVGLGAGGPVPVQWGLFSALSVVSLLLFRKRLLERFKPHADLDRSLADMVGGVAMLGEDLEPGATGKAEFRGTAWSVRNLSDKRLAKGQRCTVERVDGLTLGVREESKDR